MERGLSTKVAQAGSRSEHLESYSRCKRRVYPITGLARVASSATASLSPVTRRGARDTAGWSGRQRLRRSCRQHQDPSVNIENRPSATWCSITGQRLSTYRNGSPETPIAQTDPPQRFHSFGASTLGDRQHFRGRSCWYRRRKPKSPKLNSGSAAPSLDEQFGQTAAWRQIPIALEQPTRLRI